MNDKSLIYYASHDNDGDWEFFCKECTEKPDLNYVRIALLEEICNKDISATNLLSKNDGLKIGEKALLTQDGFLTTTDELSLASRKNDIYEVNRNRNNGDIRSDISGKKGVR